jgi:hypothetical protein
MKIGRVAGGVAIIQCVNGKLEGFPIVVPRKGLGNYNIGGTVNYESLSPEEKKRVSVPAKTLETINETGTPTQESRHVGQGKGSGESGNVGRSGREVVALFFNEEGKMEGFPCIMPAEDANSLGITHPVDLDSLSPAERMRAEIPKFSRDSSSTDGSGEGAHRHHHKHRPGGHRHHPQVPPDVSSANPRSPQSER